MSLGVRSRLTEVLQALTVSSEPAVKPVAASGGGNCEFVVANDRRLREDAWQLVYEVYRTKGYIASHPSRLRVILQDAHPQTVTYLVRDRAQKVPVATLTVVPDSPLGLPMDRNCGPELAALRNSGRRLCEIAKLVQAEPEPGGCGADIGAILFLFRLAFLKCWKVEGATDMIVSAVPRHARFYQNVLLFEPLGEARSYASVGETVGVPMRLDVSSAKERYRLREARRPGRSSIFELFFDDQEAEIVDWLRSEERPMTEDQLAHFFAENSDLLRNAGAAELACLRELYAACGLERALASRPVAQQMLS